MSAITLKSTFGAVTVNGLVPARGLAELFVTLFADEDVREALQRGLDATKDLFASEGRSADAEAQARLDEALGVIADAIRGESTAVHLEPEEARRLRDLLIAARLGQGRADGWQARRRIA